MTCPDQTWTNLNHTACYGHELLTWGNYTVSISELSGIKQGQEGYFKGICTLKRLKLFCHDSFYGPVHGEDNFFYLSVLNPSQFDLPNYSKLDTLPLGYAYGVINKSYLTLSEAYYNTPDDECLTNYEKLIVNLGSRISSVNRTTEGFTVSYDNGAPCDIEGDQRFETDIIFVCSKGDGDGWPMFISRDQCKYTFRWRTKYACKICEPEDMVQIRGACEDGERTISEVPGPNCIFLNHTH